MYRLSFIFFTDTKEKNTKEKGNFYSVHVYINTYKYVTVTFSAVVRWRHDSTPHRNFYLTRAVIHCTATRVLIIPATAKALLYRGQSGFQDFTSSALSAVNMSAQFLSRAFHLSYFGDCVQFISFSNMPINLVYRNTYRLQINK